MKRNQYFILLFLIGLVLRLLLTFHLGNADMNSYYEWGNNVLNNGLYESYLGIYFPLQIQFFSICSWLSRLLNINWIIVYKLFNLLFETGVFVLLAKLLIMVKAGRYYSFVYWLHPWFLLNYSQGFVDAQFSFFVILSVILFYKYRNIIYSGIPFAIVFMLKPQVLMLSFALFVYFFIVDFKTKYWKRIYFFIPTYILYSIYTGYFAIQKYYATQGTQSISVLINNILYLPKTYLGIYNVSPCLTCSLPNLWYPIAYILSEGRGSIGSVSSRIQIFPNITVGNLALITTIITITCFAYILERKRKIDEPEKILRIILFEALLVPFFLTSAHINHPYLGTVILIPFLAKYSNSQLEIFGKLLLMVLAIYLFVVYGFGQNLYPISNYIRLESRLPLSFLSIIGSFGTLWFLYKYSIKELK